MSVWLYIGEVERDSPHVDQV